MSLPSRNHHIKLHQVQDLLTTCFTYLDLSDLVDCLNVCREWRMALKKNRRCWSSCTYTFGHPLPREYHSVVSHLRVEEHVDEFAPNALEAFTRVTSLYVRESPRTKLLRSSQPGLESFFGFAQPMDRSRRPKHWSPIISFHLNWRRSSGSPFPLLQLLTHPRFALLQELKLQESDPISTDAMRAISELKELKQLTCHVRLISNDDAHWRGAPNRILFEVIHELPLLHTLNVGEIPVGIAPPLPSTITDLSIDKFPRDPAGLCTVFGSLNALKSFSFGIFSMLVDHPKWVDWVEWLNHVKTLEVVHIFLGGDRHARETFMVIVVVPFVLHNASQLSIRLVSCDEVAMRKLELVRGASPPSATEVSLVDKSSKRPRYYFRELAVQVRSLKVVYFLNIPLTNILKDCLAYLSSTRNVAQRFYGLEHLEIGFDSIALDPIDLQKFKQFCEFLSQQSQLHTLVLQGQWIHKYHNELSLALQSCRQLTSVQLDSYAGDQCGDSCTSQLAQTLSHLPHLIYLRLEGSCLSHLTNLTYLVQSNSIRRLSVHQPSNSDRVHEIAQFLVSYPHIHPRLNGQPPHELVRRVPTTPLGEEATKKPVPTTPPHAKRRCLIQ